MLQKSESQAVTDRHRKRYAQLARKWSTRRRAAADAEHNSNQRFESPLPHHSRTSRIASTGIVEYGFWMRKEGYSETTIERYVRLLKELAKHGHLRDPESIKVGLTRTAWSDGTKERACGAYAICARQRKISSSSQLP